MQTDAIDFTTKTQFVDALLACPAIQDRQTRDSIVSALKNVRGISRSDIDRTDVANIVDRVPDFPGAMGQLVEALRFYEGNSVHMQRVDVLYGQHSKTTKDTSTPARDKTGRADPISHSYRLIGVWISLILLLGIGWLVWEGLSDKRLAQPHATVTLSPAATPLPFARSTRVAIAVAATEAAQPTATHTHTPNLNQIATAGAQEIVLAVATLTAKAPTATLVPPTSTSTNTPVPPTATVSSTSPPPTPTLSTSTFTPIPPTFTSPSRPTLTPADTPTPISTSTSTFIPVPPTATFTPAIPAPTLTAVARATQIAMAVAATETAQPTATPTYTPNLDQTATADAQEVALAVAATQTAKAPTATDTPVPIPTATFTPNARHRSGSGTDSMDIITTAVLKGDFQMLVAAIFAADLADTLRRPGPYTLFAPTDEAFGQLEDGLYEQLILDSYMPDILLYHVIPGIVTAEDIAGMDSETITTVLGEDLEISVDGDTVMINGVTVTTVDISASNGIIHVVDSVIMPPSE